MGRIEILKCIELFAEMTDRELEAIDKCVAEATVAAGDVLIEEDLEGDTLFLIRVGSVVVLKRLGAEEVEVARLGPGKAFGEMSLLDDFPPSATVRALEPCELLTISRLDLNVLLNWDTVLAAKMWRSFARSLSGRLRDANEALLARVEGQPAGERTLELSKDVLAAVQGGSGGDDPAL